MFRRSAAIASLALMGFTFMPAAHASHDGNRNDAEDARETACANFATETGGDGATSAYDNGPAGTLTDDTCTVTSRETSVDEDRSRVNNERAAKPVTKVDRTTVTYDEATEYRWLVRNPQEGVLRAGWQDPEEPVATEVARTEEKCVDNPSGERCRKG